jgi:hypothetical protein
MSTSDSSGMEESYELEPLDLTLDTIARRVKRDLPPGGDLPIGRFFWHGSRRKFLHAKGYSGSSNLASSSCGRIALGVSTSMRKTLQLSALASETDVTTMNESLRGLTMACASRKERIDHQQT